MSTATDTKINLDSLSAQDLTRPENFQAIKQQAYSLIDNFDYGRAIGFARRLSTKLDQHNPTDERERYFTNILRFWVFRLKLFAYADLTATEKTELIQNHILAVIAQGVDVKKTIAEYVRIFSTPSIIMEETNNLIFALKQNRQTLGGNSEAFKTANFRPTLVNWIGQYIASTNTAKVKAARSGSFEITNFLGSNQYVKYLSNDEKEILKSVLDFYNFLSSPIIYADIMSARPPAPAGQKMPLMPPPPAPPTKPLIPIVIPDQPAVPAVKKPVALNENLYRSTLDELEKMRQQEKQPVVKPAVTPLDQIRDTEPPKQFSVNDALARGVFGSDGGGVTSGESEIEKKLKDLKDKFKQ